MEIMEGEGERYISNERWGLVVGWGLVGGMVERRVGV